jgi:hypothetical protein
MLVTHQAFRLQNNPDHFNTGALSPRSVSMILSVVQGPGPDLGVTYKDAKHVYPSNATTVVSG